MATDTERLVLQLSADLRTFQKDMTRAAGEADRAAQRVERRFQQMNRQISRDFGNMASQVNGILAAIGVGVVVRDVVALGDTWTRVGNRLAFAGVESSRLAATQQLVADIASRTRSDLESTADLFARMYRSSEDLGASLGQVALVTETVSKALAGASESERAGAIRQLGQGLGSGRLQGDELRSILENSRPIAEAIAAEFETTVGNLRVLGAQGVLESRRVFQAIMNAAPEIEAAYARTTFTVADSFTRLRTEAARYIGTNERTAGSNRALVATIDAVASNFDLLADAALIAATVVGGVFAGAAVGQAVRALQSLIAQMAVAETRAVRMQALSTFFGGPFGIAIAAAAVSMGVLATQTDLFTSSAQAAARAADSTYSALQFIANLEVAVGDAVATGAEFVGELKNVAAETDNLAGLADDAATAIDGMSDASRSAAGAADLQSDAERRLADQMRLTNIQRIEAAILDQEAIQAAIDRERIMRGIMSNAVGDAARNPALAFLLTPEEQQRLRESQELVDLYRQSLTAYRSGRLVDPDEGAGAGNGGNGPNGRDRAASGQTIADLERQAELTLARLRHDMARVQELEDAEALEKRTAAYIAAGAAAADARARAEAEVTAERAASNAEAQRSYELSQLQDQIEIARIANSTALVDKLSDEHEIRRRTRDIVDQLRISEEEALQRATEYVQLRREALDIERQRALELREVEHQAELAQRRGDTTTERTLRRKLEIEERIAELRSRGVGDEAAVDRAQAEVAALAQADLQGQFRRWFTGGVTAALEGDLDDFFENWLRERAAAGLEAALNDVADVLFQSFTGAFTQALGGGQRGIGDSIAAAVAGGGRGGLAKLSGDAIQAGETLKGTLGVAAANAAANVILQSTAAAAAAGQDTAITAQKWGSALQLLSAEALLTKSAFSAAAALQAVAASGAAGGGGGKGGFVSTLLSAGLKILGFGGFKAGGGPVNVGNAYIVGERGPELFVPQQFGNIIPTGGFGAPPPVNVIDARKITITGASSVEMAQLRAELDNDFRTRASTTVAIVQNAMRQRQLR